MKITLNSLFVFLPLLVSIIGVLVILFKRNKSYSQYLFVAYQVLVCLFFLSEGFYLMGDANYDAVVIIDVINMFVTPAIPVFIYLYVISLRTKIVQVENSLVLLIPSLLLGIGTFVIYFVIGFDETASYLAACDSGDVSAYNHPLYSLIKLWTEKFYLIVMSLELFLFFLAVIISMIRNKINPFSLLGFFFAGKTSSTSVAVVSNLVIVLLMLAVRLVLGRQYFVDHQIFCWTYSAIISIVLATSFAYARLPHLEGVTFRDVMKKGSKLLKIDPSLLDVSSKAEASGRKTSVSLISLENDAQLIYNFLVVDKYYLNSLASVKDAASSLGLSKTRLNSVVSTYCGCGFKQLLKYCRKNMDD